MKEDKGKEGKELECHVLVPLHLVRKTDEEKKPKEEEHVKR